jgi:hypothetical protein
MVDLYLREAERNVPLLLVLMPKSFAIGKKIQEITYLQYSRRPMGNTWAKGGTGCCKSHSYVQSQLT